ncbi:hypothetical protein ACHQM5_006217 [Ranunculus cassubicifolius]
MKLKRKIPSLVDLCIQTTIDNLRYLGDVGETDIELLKDILPHCTADQLMRIEKSTQGRDLSSVTNKLWRRFFQQKFGMETFHSLSENLKRNKVVFTWRMLYEAQLEDLELVQKENAEKLKQKYREENLKKQSRQVQIVSKVPPSSNKRNFCFGGGGGGGGWNSSPSKFPNAKGNLMKKARMEFLNSHEVKAQSVMKRIALKSSQSARPVKPTSFARNASSSSSNSTKPYRRP